MSIPDTTHIIHDTDVRASETDTGWGTDTAADTLVSVSIPDAATINNEQIVSTSIPIENNIESCVIAKQKVDYTAASIPDNNDTTITIDDPVPAKK